MTLPWWFPFGHVPEILARELAARLSAQPPLQIVDVRSHFEFARGHIRGAVNVPIGAFRRRLDGLKLDRSRPVVAICLTGHRSIPAVRLLRQRGYDAFQLAGGMIAWRAAGLADAPGRG